jgi:hypothetical protein
MVYNFILIYIVLYIAEQSKAKKRKVEQFVFI